MAMIDDGQIEWKVVARLRELLDRPPEAEHDVTLAYSLFTGILCWTCQRMRDKGRPLAIWTGLQQELAADHPWGLLGLHPQVVLPGDLTTLPASVFLIALRNATAHGDDRTVKPLHTGVRSRADRRLTGFVFDAEFYDKETKQHWGRWRLSLSVMDMRRIGLALADRFCDQLGGDARRDAERHVLVA